MAYNALVESSLLPAVLMVRRSQWLCKFKHAPVLQPANTLSRRRSLRICPSICSHVRSLLRFCLSFVLCYSPFIFFSRSSLYFKVSFLYFFYFPFLVSSKSLCKYNCVAMSDRLFGKVEMFRKSNAIFDFPNPKKPRIPNFCRINQ